MMSDLSFFVVKAAITVIALGYLGFVMLKFAEYYRLRRRYLNALASFAELEEEEEN